MRLVRYGPAGAEKPGLVDAGGTLRDLSRVARDITPALLGPAVLARLRGLKVVRLPVVKGRPRLAVRWPVSARWCASGLTKGKSADTFGPVGPWLVTADAVPDPQALGLWTTVNGDRRQDGNTCHMVFPVRELVAYVSRFMSLQAGDLISTGTPAGVGHGAKPPRYLQPGDVVEMGIDRLSVQRHVIVEWKLRGGRRAR
jgi:hypothetical protein